MRSHFASLKMHCTHAHRKLLPKWVLHAHRNLLPHIAPPQVAAHTTTKHEKLGGAKVKPVLTSHLWYKAMLKVWRKSWDPFRIYQLTKGQIISKANYVILNSSKKRTKKFDFTTKIPQVDLFSFVSWRKLKTPIRHFEINWPLAQPIQPNSFNYGRIGCATGYLMAKWVK